MIEYSKVIVAGRGTDKRNCVVIALSLAFGKPYDHVFQTLKDGGRRNNCGTRRNLYAPLIEAYGKTKHKKPRVGKSNLGTLNRFIMDKPEGRFIVRISGHLFVVINGVVNDTWEPSGNVRIKEYWQVI